MEAVVHLHMIVHRVVATIAIMIEITEAIIQVEITEIRVKPKNLSHTLYLR